MFYPNFRKLYKEKNLATMVIFFPLNDQALDFLERGAESFGVSKFNPVSFSSFHFESFPGQVWNM
jgi:hypothetical protein